MIDVVFCNLPYSNLDYIYSAPAILKSVAVKHGYTAKTIDFGCELYKLCNKDVDKFNRIQQYFISSKVESDEQQDIIDKFYQLIASWFIENPSKFIGLSVFSTWSQRAAFEIVNTIRKCNINSKIIVGGRGANTPVYKLNSRKFNFSTLDQLLPFGQVLQKKKLIDFWVPRDGEDAILDILSTDAILQEHLNDDQFYSVVPDYSDYDFDAYLIQDGQIEWPITGSKGCVRDCDFCDVKKQFGKYKYRSGADIATEMIELAKTINAKKFIFTDSLVNGGTKPFREFLEIVADYNDTNPQNKITWSGQYICKTSVPADIYPLIARAGGQGLTIGAESGSNEVLHVMNKKTSINALLTELDQFRHNNITCVLLFLQGYWSETWDNFVENCETLVKLAPYVRSGTISAMDLGSLLNIVDNTPIYDKHVIDGKIKLSEADPGFIWHVETNPTNHIVERVYRQLLVSKLANFLKIPVVRESTHYFKSLNILNSSKDSISAFYAKNSVDITKSTAKDFYFNFNNFLDLFFNNNIISINLEVCANSYNSDPALKIEHNNTVIYYNSLSTGKHNIKLTVPAAAKNCLTFSMDNKNTNTDTLVIDGNIVCDKNITLKKLYIDNYELTSDYDFFNNLIRYYNIDHNRFDVPMMGWWNNSKLILEFDKSFSRHYNTNTEKNSATGNGLLNRKIQVNDSSGILNELLVLLGELTERPKVLPC